MHETKDIERMFRTHYRRMFLTARTLLCNDEEARDVVSDVFERILTSAEVFPASDKRQGEAAYLLTAVRNRCLNILAHRMVEKRANAMTIGRMMTEDLPYEELPIDDILHYIATELTPQTSRVVTMRYTEGQTYNAIGHALGISRTAVFKHIAQGLQKLKKRFNTDNE